MNTKELEVVIELDLLPNECRCGECARLLVGIVCATPQGVLPGACAPVAADISRRRPRQIVVTDVVSNAARIAVRNQLDSPARRN